MTKSTKIIAALGVAAGLGIAALPAGAIFAADDLIPFDEYGTTGASADVEVKLTVGSAVAIAVEKSECNAGATQVKSVAFCTEKVAGGSNAENGFTVYVADADDDTALSSADDTIDAVDGAVFSGTNVWAKAGWNLTGGLLEDDAITTSENPVFVAGGPKDAQIEMTYNIATRADQKAGEYSDTITYTIQANDAAAEDAGLEGALVEVHN